MAPRRGARELELEAAARPAAPAAPAAAAGAAGNEALAMLARRGLRPRVARPDVPFPRELDGALADALAARLGHYGFRLFLRGAIAGQGPFRPAEVTRYLTPAQAERAAEELVDLGLAARVDGGLVRLRWRARSFGGTLEWWVARELRRRLAADVAACVRSGAPGVGGDLDVVAAVEGKLVYVELKSSPPKHLMPAEVAAFLRRVRSLRPHLSLFAVDTALRLPDKVLPMLLEAAGRSGPPRRLQRDCWEVAPRLYAVNARPDLVANLCLAIADGLHQLAPEPP
ncbi:hypothetical protein [Anaeromyxobacter diazotrophicus]|uniref:Uncharacterized protein n=1 Tax=Anaeromyxobacter diazotrophicus TaxID=2590199 RepID=A0A7I9VM33_9BACT|nr:hypothetical protein [Anaeromyxobacter diazotrophicus]GEJ57037.1 hypothetical protein AMYX_17780 [Anaeromyxobacter diazotrophicus]